MNTNSDDKCVSVSVEVTYSQAIARLLFYCGIFAALLTVCLTVYPFWYVWVAMCAQALAVLTATLRLIVLAFGTLTVTYKTKAKK